GETRVALPSVALGWPAHRRATGIADPRSVALRPHPSLREPARRPADDGAGRRPPGTARRMHLAGLGGPDRALRRVSAGALPERPSTPAVLAVHHSRLEVRPASPRLPRALRRVL